jgi:thioredoxin-related protein
MRLIPRFLFVVMMLSLAAPAMPADPRDPDQHFFNLNIGDLKSELTEAKSARRKAILVMFEQDGCPGCLYMRTNVLNRADVQSFYRERFLNFSINIFGAVPIKDFSGRELTEKTFSQAIDIIATPTFVFYDTSGAEVVRFVGPVKDAGEFMLLGQFVASGAYKTRKFADYLQTQRKPKGS